MRDRILGKMLRLRLSLADKVVDRRCLLRTWMGTGFTRDEAGKDTRIEKQLCSVCSRRTERRRESETENDRKIKPSRS